MTTQEHTEELSESCKDALLSLADDAKHEIASADAEIMRIETQIHNLKTDLNYQTGRRDSAEGWLKTVKVRILTIECTMKEGKK